MMISRTGTDAAPARRGPPARAPAAFTLIELLVVMGIIGVLLGMLLPAVNRVVVASRNAACANRIAQIEAALATFKNDWGVYPPSDKDDNDADTLVSECPGTDSGYGLLCVALIGPGPEAKGWGRAVADEDYKLPFSGTDKTTAYGPYYQGDFRWTGRDAFIPDAFPAPDRPILYYRYDRGTGQYDYEDNPRGDIDEGFQSETHFELSATYEVPDSREPRVRRKDYLLICAGADRMYGYITDDDPPRAATRRTEVTDGSAICDDITNYGQN